ncbi:hypothetical protein [Burkholderia cepacia]|uniref:hypothetical protein n=1 Tax=Burkholderia cepacia TaxID=292 RepID=UPI0012D9A704|nr:hypothetical protein [Burkholderia cepacia]
MNLMGLENDVEPRFGIPAPEVIKALAYISVCKVSEAACFAQKMSAGMILDG